MWSATVRRGGSMERTTTFRAEEFRAPLESEPRQFRFIVSPEDGERLDLAEFTRQFMRQVEKDTGRRLIWAAVNHHNTDNPHVHIVIRGVDRDGDELRIDGRYIGREMRWRAQEIVTRELGPRPEIDYSRTRAAEVERERFTEIDEVIAEHADADGTADGREIARGARGRGARLHRAAAGPRDHGASPARTFRHMEARRWMAGNPPPNGRAQRHHRAAVANCR